MKLPVPLGIFSSFLLARGTLQLFSFRRCPFEGCSDDLFDNFCPHFSNRAISSGQMWATKAADFEKMRRVKSGCQLTRVDMVEGCSKFEYSPEWSFFTVDQGSGCWGPSAGAHVQESPISGGSLARAGRGAPRRPGGAAVARRRHGLFCYCEHWDFARCIAAYFSREFLGEESFLPEEPSGVEALR
jgi:hypothetical protein